ncbi:presequence translocated-associated motor subunit PAM17 [Roridomyces roridus]|uniref:Presequence translocated-associated motor subunit PAM17 n=1 Tax=Roridomyces roridus TaxID=1738132 RepID=A0AAD7BXK6_9AGAR|nr:presequence translocated-associated motor subunit PAM17 [Roridomyces roridus]
MQQAWTPLRHGCRALPRLSLNNNKSAGSSLFFRLKSTTPKSKPTTTPKEKTTIPSEPQVASVVADELKWAEYLKIRRRRRQLQTAFTIPCAAVGFFGGVAYFGSLQTDPTKPIMGIDPMMFYAGCCLLCMGGGFVVGPSIGSAIWRLVNRNLISKIDARDREFYTHIARNRVDASLQSATNPIPDYYGEKIGSLKGYRQWLRDQSKYRKKASLTVDV